MLVCANNNTIILNIVPCKGSMVSMNSSKLGCNCPKLGCIKSAIFVNLSEKNRAINKIFLKIINNYEKLIGKLHYTIYNNINYNHCL